MWRGRLSSTRSIRERRIRPEYDQRLGETSLKTVYLLLALLLGASSGEGATYQKLDELDVGRFPFCDSPEANLGLLARVEAQVGLAHPSFKEWEQANAELVREGIDLAKELSDPD